MKVFLTHTCWQRPDTDAVWILSGSRRITAAASFVLVAYMKQRRTYEASTHCSTTSGRTSLRRRYIQDRRPNALSNTSPAQDRRELNMLVCEGGERPGNGLILCLPRMNASWLRHSTTNGTRQELIRRQVQCAAHSARQRQRCPE